jgi:hypothetical protein
MAGERGGWERNDDSMGGWKAVTNVLRTVREKGTATRPDPRQSLGRGVDGKLFFASTALSLPLERSLYYRFYTTGPPVYQQQQKRKNHDRQTDRQTAWPAFYGLGEEDGQAD